MLLKRDVLDRIADGSISLVFRRWRRPSVKAGGSLTTAIGMLAIDEITEVPAAAIDDASAHRAGHASAEALRTELAKHPEGRVYRIAVRLASADPRIALREDDRLDDEDVAGLEARLDRFDGTEPWTRRALALIGAHPGRRAAELAEAMGLETQAFKTRVRKLKGLGLTESLETGYRLSPRARALLARVEASPGQLLAKNAWT